MRNPINKRILRDLAKEWKRYVVLFLLMSFMIGTASGMYVANGSMLKAFDDSYDKYNLEDGHLEFKEEPTEELLAAMPGNINLYEQFYKEVSEVSDGNDSAAVRVFKIREDLNIACVIEGRLPEGTGEIAIDRMHADNNGISIGDTITVNGTGLQVVGFIALPDYSTLFKKNSDIMFNAIDFDVALVTEDAWEELPGNVKYQYAFRYDTAPASVYEEKEWGDDLMEKIAVIAATGGYTDDKDVAEELADNVDEWTSTLENMDENTSFEDISEAIDNLESLEPYEDNTNELIDFLPGYANQAIHFAPEDFGSDVAIMGVLVYVFIAVLAFVFAITTSNTIVKEAAVIGTLRATGYTRGELTVYYMMMPVIITLLSAVTGNVLGYTIFKDAVVSMYYNSYSLPTYETVWNAEAFIKTTLIPLVLMFIINLFIIVKKMRLSPLKFLRRDLSSSKRKKAVRLPRIKFFSRFRLRILLQNLGSYFVLFFGIAFVMLLLSFSIGLPETLDHYKHVMTEELISEYQYILMDYEDEDGNVITTDNGDAEKFSMNTLETIDGVHVGEGITIYGIEDDSKYVKADLPEDGVLVSSAYALKFMLHEGDTITLKEKYSDKTYSFVVRGIYKYMGGLSVFMRNDDFNECFDLDDDSFTGFLSSGKIDDIDEDLIYTIVTREDIMALSIQIDHSMGDYMDYVSFACLIIGILVIYLLTKIIIEKNAASISMVKVLGYENREINSLYVNLTTAIVVICAIATSLLSVLGLTAIFSVIMYTMSGWFEVYVSFISILKMIGILLISYFIVSFFDIMRIKKIPLTDALKNVE
ncbi:MAG: ABC transporter permease [Clostridiales bacterium]|nr:ABC transporter permease [Clostridiales bacterium]